MGFKIQQVCQEHKHRVGEGRSHHAVLSLCRNEWADKLAGSSRFMVLCQHEAGLSSIVCVCLSFCCRPGLLGIGCSAMPLLALLSNSLPCAFHAAGPSHMSIPSRACLALRRFAEICLGILGVLCVLLEPACVSPSLVHLVSAMLRKLRTISPFVWLAARAVPFQPEITARGLSHGKSSSGSGVNPHHRSAFAKSPAKICAHAGPVWCYTVGVLMVFLFLFAHRSGICWVSRAFESGTP